MHARSSLPLTSLLRDIHDRVQQVRKRGQFGISGHSLDIASVVAVARYDCFPTIDEVNGVLSLGDSVKVLDKSYEEGKTLYGVNTGFGGSADVRSGDRGALKKGLMQTLQSAVLTEADKTVDSNLGSGLGSHSLPVSWVKATIAVRCNSCIRGHSAISGEVIDAVLALLANGLSPIIPLRGSISASGDLMPLAYVAGAIEGSPDIFVHHIKNGKSRIETADAALASQGLSPVTLSPRDGLGLANGTSASAAVASLVFYEAGQLATLSACLTAMIAEGMSACVDWSHPFITDIRPHPGQYEASDLTRSFLRDSELVSGHGEPVTAAGSLVERFHSSLAQDRYPLRTSPQWLGPQFEDLLSAYTQIATELNSTSDNPCTDPCGGQVYNGGNFQAVAVTAAVEKIRLALQMIGKLIFAQTTEMLNSHMSNGLPANLAADEPSSSFCLKGLDINIAAYQSELAFLANPVSNHVQSAEMHNQAVNSLALLSARYTYQAIELVALMSASSLYAACQAVDLRVMHATFLQKATQDVNSLCSTALRSHVSAKAYSAVIEAGTKAMRSTWWANGSTDLDQRSDKSAWAFVLDVAGLNLTSQDRAHLKIDIAALEGLQHAVKAKLESSFNEHRAVFFQAPPTAQYLGAGTSKLYEYVRHELGVPMHRGLADHPEAGDAGSQKKTVGSRVAVIYEAIRDGRLFGGIAGTFEQLGLGELPN